MADVGLRVCLSQKRTYPVLDMAVVMVIGSSNARWKFLLKYASC